jgi:hypothetical protein
MKVVKVSWIRSSKEEIKKYAQNFGGKPLKKANERKMYEK